MSSRAPLRVAFVGFGRQASQHHARHLIKLPTSELEIVAVSDVLVEHRADAVASLEALGLSNVPILLNHASACDASNLDSISELHSRFPALDAVIISTPHAKHYHQAKRCLEYGWNVLVDKPLAETRAQADELVALARNKGLILAVASQRRYEAVYQYAKRVIEAGQLGTVTLVDALLAQSHPQKEGDGGWRANPILSGGGAIADSGWHTLDTIAWLFDCSDVELCSDLFRVQGSTLEQAGTIHIRPRRGPVIQVKVSHFAPAKSVYEQLMLAGTRGVVFLDRMRPDTTDRRDEPAHVLHQDHSGTVLHKGRLDGAAADRTAPLRAFLDTLFQRTRGSASGGAPILSAGSDSVVSVALIEGIYRSAASAGQMVCVR